MENERRKLKRKHLFEYFDVLDSTSEKLFGKLVDVTQEGIRIILCPKPIEKGSFYRLKIRVPNEFKIPDIQIEATCVWSAEEEDYYQTGFLIVCVSEYDTHYFKKIFG